MKNPTINTEELYSLAHEAAEEFLGMFPNDQLSQIFTDSFYNELEIEKNGITKLQMFHATSIVLNEIIDRFNSKNNCLMALSQILVTSDKTVVWEWVLAGKRLRVSLSEVSFICLDI